MSDTEYGLSIPAGPTRMDVLGDESSADHEAVYQFIEVLSGPSIEATNAITAHGRLLNRLSNALAYIATLEAAHREPVSDDAVPWSCAEALARDFHEAYERLAPAFGYKTREATAVRWEDVHGANRDLMVATASEILATITTALTATQSERDTEAGKVARLEAERNALEAIVKDAAAGQLTNIDVLYRYRAALAPQPTGDSDE